MPLAIRLRQIDVLIKSSTAATCRIEKWVFGNRKTRRKSIDRQEKSIRPSDSFTTRVSGDADRNDEPMIPVTGES
jgi:hypothetical protein